VLLHPTSLPGRDGSGDLGLEARGFVDFLARAQQTFWQMLPVGPPGYGDSPYSAESAFAGSPWLVSLQSLADDGLLDRASLAPSPPLALDRIDFASTRAHRARHLRAAFEAFAARPPTPAYRAFVDESASWLDDYALFHALKQAHGGVQWTRWSAPLRQREPGAIAQARRELAREIALEKFLQYAFDRQWRDLRAYAANQGVALIGDIPIFVAHDSADVWVNQDAFFLDDAGEPSVVAGCPPDYFSRTGQRWGNPLYRWKRLKKAGYAWWMGRLRVTLSRFDVVRIDHFIGFQRYWQIDATEPTAQRGRWIRGPGADFFTAVERALGALPLIAEDLGAVSRAVFLLRDRFRLPGVKILQFAFGDDPHADTFMPHNYTRRAVVYTGTHDNDTTVGWFRDRGEGHTTRSPEQCERERQAALRYLGTDGEEIHWDMIRAALASVATLVVLPLQDVLGLGSEARMNRPGTSGGSNWAWRFEAAALTPAHVERLAALTRTYERAPVERKP
jgi:4-alpha-glucanotransferase